MSTWQACLAAADFAAARAACLEEFARRPAPLEGTWELAEIEERWGDSLFFSNQPGSAIHYRAACAALAPPAPRIDSFEESDRRMQAHQRVTAKLYSIDPYDLPRAGNAAQPHPNSAPVPESPAPPVPKQSPPQPPPVAPAAPFNPQTNFAQLFPPDDHWTLYRLASLWREAGKELAPSHPASARRAFEWSLHYFDLYGEQWTAHLPASRWDSDGGYESSEVAALADALAGELAPNPSEPPLPGWACLLIDGDWQHALAAVPSPAPPECTSLAAILAEARKAAGAKATEAS